MISYLWWRPAPCTAVATVRKVQRSAVSGAAAADMPRWRHVLVMPWWGEGGGRGKTGLSASRWDARYVTNQLTGVLSVETFRPKPFLRFTTISSMAVLRQKHREGWPAIDTVAISRPRAHPYCYDDKRCTAMPGFSHMMHLASIYMLFNCNAATL